MTTSPADDAPDCRADAELAAIFNRAAVGLSELDLDGRFVRVNDELCRLLGRSREDLLAAGFADVTRPADLLAAVAAFTRVAATGEPAAHDKRCLRADGAVVWTNSALTRLEATPDRPTRVLAVTADLTARRLAEERLQESEERFRLMTQGVRDYAIFSTDPAGRVTTWNMDAERILGYSAEEVLGHSAERFFTAEDRAAGLFAGELRLATETGEADDDNWLVRRDGSRFWASGTTTAVRDAAGGLRGFVKICRDLTERKAAEEALRASEARLQLALAAARMGIWTLDVTTGRQMRDANLNRLLGLAPVGSTQPFEEFLTHMHLDDREMVRAAFANTIATGRPLNVEFRVVWPDGTVRWLLDQGDLFGETGGPAALMTGACADVTERKAAEEKLRASEARFRAVVDGATDYAIFTTDAGRRVTAWHAGAAAVFGYAAEEMVGRSGDILFTPEDRAAGEPEKEAGTAARVGRATDERWHLRKGGERFFASGVMTRLADGSGFVKVARDLSDRKRMEDRLRDAHTMLEAQVAKRTAELAAANENLRAEAAERTRAEAARAETLRRLATAQEDERHRISRDLHDQAGQTLAALALAVAATESIASPALADRLADVRRLADELGREMHGVAVRLRPTALADLGLPSALHELVADWSARNGVPADFEAAGLDGGRLPAEVETALYRFVQEALTNVAKHARAGQVSVVINRRGRFASAVVEDDGRGFDPESPSPGRLGLVGMRERLALIGGELDVESAPGAGTTVITRIPLRGVNRPS